MRFEQKSGTPCASIAACCAFEKSRSQGAQVNEEDLAFNASTTGAEKAFFERRSAVSTFDRAMVVRNIVNGVDAFCTLGTGIIYVKVFDVASS